MGEKGVLFIECRAGINFFFFQIIKDAEKEYLDYVFIISVLTNVNLHRTITPALHTLSSKVA